MTSLRARTAVACGILLALISFLQLVFDWRAGEAFSPVLAMLVFCGSALAILEARAFRDH